MSTHKAPRPNEARGPDPSRRPDPTSSSARRHAPITGAARPQRMMAPIDDDAWTVRPDWRPSPGGPPAIPEPPAIMAPIDEKA